MTTTPKAAPTWWQLVLVEPGVYWRIFALDHQAEQFEVFHRSALTRWTHYLGTQLIVGALLLLTVGHDVGPLPGPLLLGGLLTAWYLRLHVVVGVVAGAQVALLAVLATWAARAGVTPLHAVAALAALAVAQNLSHAVEPVPPVLTGRGFESFAVYWAQASGAHRLRLLLLNLFYVPLELVSAPRLFAVHVLRALHAAGWNPLLAERTRARATALLEP